MFLFLITNRWISYNGKHMMVLLKIFLAEKYGLRSENVEVKQNLVWSPYGIPRHAIHLWLVMKKRLKTQDQLRQWDVGNDVDLSLLRCPLCKSQQDSHEHLFFECAYSSSVWQNVLNVAGISGVSSQWEDIMLWLLPLSKSKTVTSIVGRLIVVATSYFLWHERNDRIHGKGDKKVEQVSKYVADLVRLKLASIKFKKNARVRKLMETWKLAFGANEN
ncbi:reverse transcriptase domain, reverse transcriptase zinc-binding domain protein [Tanacetum coccineum]